MSRNTAAASVDDTTAPTRSDSIQSKPSRNRTTGTVSAAVSRTPTVASTSEGASALRNVAQPRAQAAVEQDQGERHRADQIGRTDVIELDPAGSGFAGQHADQEKDQQQGSAEAQGNKTRQDAGQHQECREHDGETDGVECCHGP